jgi:ethanolamine utilization protein EutA
MSQSQYSLTSVGIDIGSTTSHFAISRLTLRPVSSDPDSKLEVKRREILYLSDIIFTPFKGSDQIDGEEINRFIKNGYSKIGLKPTEVDVGAVIVTGVAARKDNAELVASSISDLAGDFVCVTAGPKLEAILSAFGSGAVALSSEHHDHGPDHGHGEADHDHDHGLGERDQHEHVAETVMNVDIGGGTTKIAIARHGKIIETSALNIGARLIKWDENGLITGIEPPVLKLASDVRTNLEIGKKLDPKVIEMIAEKLVSMLFEFILFLNGRGSLSESTRDLLIIEAPKHRKNVDRIIFSGGVSEYIYGHDKTERGDMGAIMGRLIAERYLKDDLQVGKPSQFIRATVIGASHYTAQISGNTIFLSNIEDLPIKNALMIPVLMPDNLQHVHSGTIASKFLSALEPYDEHELVAFQVNSGMLGHDGVRALSAGIVEALGKRLVSGRPLILLFNANIGRQVGLSLKERHKITSSVICVDEIQPEGMAYVDIGRPVEQSGPVPVVIKSLIFDDSNLKRSEPVRMLSSTV